MITSVPSIQSMIVTIVVALIASGGFAAIINRYFPSRKSEKRADTATDVGVAQVFKEDNIALRTELRAVWVTVQQQATQIADLRDKVTALEQQNKDYEEEKKISNNRIISLEGQVASVTRENELLRARG